MDKSARLLLPSYTVLSCTIRDLSAAGARLEVDANAILSDMFDLVPKHGASSQLPVDGSANRVGVVFQG